MNRGARRREGKLGRSQSIDLEGIRNNNPQALQAALNIIDANVREQRLTKARKLCDTALSVNPKSSQLNHALGVVLQTKGDVGRAIDAYQQAVSTNPENLASWINLGLCARATHDLDTATRAFQKALAIDPKSFHGHYNLGLVYCDLKQMDNAQAALNAALEANPDSAEANFQLAFLQELQGNHEDAIEHYRRSLKSKPNWGRAHMRLGACLQMVGRFTEGADHLKQAIQLNPMDAHAHFLLASSEEAEVDAGFTARLEQIAERPDLPKFDRAELHFAAGRLHERSCNFDKAFECYRSGNEIRNEAYQFEKDELIGMGERIRATFTPEYFAKHAGSGSPSQRPVFVCGIPRSGTTLVEQIIASHPAAYGAGELSNILKVCTLPGAQPATEYPECMADLKTEDFAGMAERYLAAYPSAAATSERVVDKTPGNALWLGMIALMFPNAAIIHCRRDTMDTLWSCYSQNFFSDVRYACDFENLAAYNTLHEMVMEHWRTVLPVSITEVSYEALVADPDTHIPRIIAAIGLDWDERCLNFHQTDRSVNTTSLWQVRRPMFQSSVGKWKNFETHLGPLKAALERYAT